MILNLYIDDQAHPIDVPEEMLNEGGELFAKMDADMDRGWQMSHTWVESPNPVERAQIAADRLLQAHKGGNETMASLMAGYILSRLPRVERVILSTLNDMTEHQIILP